MFGYVRPPIDLLDEAEKNRFQRAYCGLCHTLGERYGLAGFIGDIDIPFDDSPWNFAFAVVLINFFFNCQFHTNRCPHVDGFDKAQLIESVIG